jgi:diguanylate cyclase (GGDEF)-like protein/PAS domain S-box-containing protein
MNFLRLGLKARLYCGFGVLVLIGLVVAGFAVWKLSAIKTEVQKFSALNDNTTRALEVSKWVQIIRRANLRYTIDADEAWTKEAAAAESSATELLKAAADATLSEERRTIYNDLKSDVDSLRSKRETLVSLGKQIQVDRAKLFSVGDELSAAAAKLVEERNAISDRSIAALMTSIESSVLLVRVANWRFLATRDPKGPATFKVNAEQAVASIAALEKVELPDRVYPLVRPIKAALADYVASFESLAANMLKGDDLYWKSMVPETVNIVAKIDKAEASLKQDSDTTKTETFAAIDVTTAAEQVMLGLALVGVLIAWFVGRSIIKPVACMTGAMERLAAGDNAVEIPSRDGVDEIGAMARALEVFKQSGIDRIRVESEQKAFLDAVIENVPVTIIVKDARDLRFVLVNRAAEDLCGLPRAEIIGKNAHELFPKDEADLIEVGDAEVLQSGHQLLIDEQLMHTPRNGTRLVTSRRLAILGPNREPEYVLGVIEDITERRRAEERIAHLAHHDPLTDLPNRAAFNAHLDAVLARAMKSGDPFALIAVDLDRFKEVNDAFGHSAGDALLCDVTKRLKDAADGAFVARLGGDEFTVICENGPQPATAEVLAGRLQAAVAGDINIAGHQLRIGLSIGIAIFPTDAADAAVLQANADAALYRTKAEGRGTVRFFAADMDKRLRERRALQRDLQRAVERGELAIHYQPQSRVGNGVTGFEALVRWHHPSRGMIAPNTFIPMAEESGLIISIGEWILRETCREAASWPRPLQIAVNLSPVQFQHGDLPAMVHAVLLETGLAANRLELEITEGVLIGDFSRALSVLRRLKALGVRIAMDDFGTGYSSLSYLQSFPFDKIKIDQSFVSNLNRSSQSAAIIRAVIGLGRGLKLPVIAEGVETAEQLAFLTEEACDEVQGYLVGRPLPIEEYADLIGRSPIQAQNPSVAV